LQVRELMQEYVQSLGMRDFVLLCNVVRDERARRESTGEAPSGLLGLLNATSLEAFGVIDTIVPSSRVLIMMRTCRRAREIVKQSFESGILPVLLTPKASASEQQLLRVLYSSYGSGTVELRIGSTTHLVLMMEAMRRNEKENMWTGPRSLCVSGCDVDALDDLCMLLPSFKSLVHLELCESGIDDEAARNIALGLPGLENLESLILGENDVSASLHANETRIRASVSASLRTQGFFFVLLDTIGRFRTHQPLQ